MTLHVYEIEDGATTHYAAETMVEAVSMHLAGISENDIDELTVSKKRDDCQLSVRQTDEPGQPLVTKLCGEWATEKGMICCSEY